MASVLFTPITMRGLTLPNRVVVSPMCQYNSDNGSANDWHLMWLGNMSLGAAGLVITEMTNVNPQGRISPKCAGIWSDDNEKALKRVHDFCRQYGVAKLGVQLAHAGRKGPQVPPGAGGKPMQPTDAGGWVPEAPSAIPGSPDRGRSRAPRHRSDVTGERCPAGRVPSPRRAAVFRVRWPRRRSSCRALYAPVGSPLAS